MVILFAFLFAIPFAILFATLCAILLTVLLAILFAATIQVLFLILGPAMYQEDHHRSNSVLFFELLWLCRAPAEKLQTLQELKMMPLALSTSVVNPLSTSLTASLPIIERDLAASFVQDYY